MAATVVLLGGLLIIADWEAIRGVLAESNWVFVLPALAITAISYVCLSYSFAEVELVDGYPDPDGTGWRGSDSFRQFSIISCKRAAWQDADSLRLDATEGVPLNDVLAASILHFYLTSLAMQAFLPLGFVYLFFKATLSRTVSIAFGTLTAALILLFVAESLLVFRSKT